VPSSAEFATATLDEIEEIAAIGDDLYAAGNKHAKGMLRRWRAAAYGGQRSCTASLGGPEGLRS